MWEPSFPIHTPDIEIVLYILSAPTVLSHTSTFPRYCWVWVSYWYRDLYLCILYSPQLSLPLYKDNELEALLALLNREEASPPCDMLDYFILIGIIKTTSLKINVASYLCWLWGFLPYSAVSSLLSFISKKPFTYST